MPPNRKYCPTETTTPIEPRAHAGFAPLASTQTALWNRITQQQGGMSQRIVVVKSRLRGELDAGLLQQSLESVMQRHEALRTTIDASSNTPRQAIATAPDCDWEVVDLAHVAPLEVAVRLGEIIASIAEEPIDPRVGPLLSARLCRLSVDEHVLIIAIDHLVTDMISNVILLRELMSAYEQLAREGQVTFRPLRVQFGDYAAWQQCTFPAWQRENGDYWRDRLAAAPRTHYPIIDRPRETVHSSTHETMEVHLDRALTARLRETARAARTSLASVVLVAYLTAMSRWCDQRDFIIVSLSHGRLHPDLIDMIGFLASKLHLRVELADRDTFVDLLRKVDTELAAANAHHDFNRAALMYPECCDALPFDWMPPSRTPRLHSNAVPASVRIEPLDQGFTLPRPIGTAHPLFPLFTETGDGILGSARYQPNVFEHGSIAGLCADIRLVAERMALDPSARALR